MKYINIFVLGTGRCGTTSWTKACKHIKNYSSSQESRTGFLNYERLNYPANHIEIDNRLSWFLGRLDERYGNNSFYVHLQRDAIPVAKSFVARFSGGIIKAYQSPGITNTNEKTNDPLDIALDYHHTVNSNIKLFLKDKHYKMNANLENAKQDFKMFCNLIDADINLDEALKEFDIKHNATPIHVMNKKVNDIYGT